MIGREREREIHDYYMHVTMENLSCFELYSLLYIKTWLDTINTLEFTITAK